MTQTYINLTCSLTASFLSLSGFLYAQSASYPLSSPDGQTWVEVRLDGSRLTYTAGLGDAQSSQRQVLVEPSGLGLRTNIGDFTQGLTFQGEERAHIDTLYRQDRIKRSEVHYVANELTLKLVNAEKRPIHVVLRASNGGDIALRYQLPKHGETGSVRILEECTDFAFPSQTTTFLSPQSTAMIGWKRTKPSYEEEYTPDAPMDQASQYGCGYTFPALFHVGQSGWVLVNETDVDSRYCGSRLSDYQRQGDKGFYRIAFPMPTENNGNGTSEPAFALPGHTPWRTLTLGSTLAPIVETTAPWDLTSPRYTTPWERHYGKGTWSWILGQDNSINYNDQVRYIDLAASMGFSYALVDNWWDTNIGREGMKKLSDYAQSKGVHLFVWYSSSGYWNDIVQGPINRMDNSILRKQEMKWLQSIGAKGIKVDFFAGDKQETMRLYEDILSDANEYGLMVIFHGCTLPRGWERLYPNYVGSEAVLASENMYFSQHFCDAESFNTCLHPFIRNTVGCMEFGGCFLNKRLNMNCDGGNTRRTTDVFELATAVLFQNPIQNFALAPINLENAPKVCLDFLRDVPTTWDDVRFLEGYPGQYIAMARRHVNKWYIAAVSAAPGVKDLKLRLPEFAGKVAQCYTSQGPDATATLSEVKFGKKGELHLKVKQEDGVIIVVECP